MSTSTGHEASELPHPKVKSVSATILGEFFDTLAKDEMLTDIAPKLRKTVLDDGIFAEPAIRTALFPDAP
ncbi:hypothetical protein [Shumkonia mesophila]|uniref:hypothetical protein n=1 Tax=Shumkonia mesophila TaxID=2838854 RepID=UPI00293526DA|nr:hypothetical protein [Shumkonia mesophila]